MANLNNINMIRTNYNTNTTSIEGEPDEPIESNVQTEQSSRGKHWVGKEKDVYSILSASNLYVDDPNRPNPKSKDANILLTKLFELREDPDEFKKILEIGVNLLEHEDPKVREMAASHLAGWAKNRSYGKMIANLCAGRLSQHHQLKLQIAQLKCNSGNLPDEQAQILEKLERQFDNSTFDRRDPMMDYFALKGHKADQESWYKGLKAKFDALDVNWFGDAKDKSKDYCHISEFPLKYFPQLDFDEKNENYLSNLLNEEESSGLIKDGDIEVAFYKKHNQLFFFHDKKLPEKFIRKLKTAIENEEKGKNLQLGFGVFDKDLIKEIPFKIANGRNDPNFLHKFEARTELKYRGQIDKLDRQLTEWESKPFWKHLGLSKKVISQNKKALEKRLNWEDTPINRAVGAHILPEGLIYAGKDKKVKDNFGNKFRYQDDSAIIADREIRKVKLELNEPNNNDQIENADGDDENGAPIVSSLDPTSKPGEIDPEALNVNEQINSDPNSWDPKNIGVPLQLESN